ncbi:ABC transporter permease subunit [candidate division KSB1 bacterium]|nr:ABC transporter permease subunit [candidate division KSB1 bacterium]
MRKRINSRKYIQRLVAYSSLTLGAIIFLIPFFWLLTTSMKTNEEYQALPIRWLPPLPYPVQQSPLVATDEFSVIPKPINVTDQIWEQVQPTLLDSAWGRIQALNNPLLTTIQAESSKWRRLHAPLKQTLLRGVLARIIEELRERVYEKSPYEMITELSQPQRLDSTQLAALWSDLVLLVRDSTFVLSPAQLDSIRHFAANPKSEELYLAAWNTGLERIGDFRWEENLKKQVERQAGDLWQPLLRYYGKKLWRQLAAAGGPISPYRTPPEIIQTILKGVHADRLDKILVNIYRNLIISTATVQGQNGQEYVLADSGNPAGIHWYDANQHPAPQYVIDAKTAVELAYDFSRQDSTQYSFLGQLPIPFDQIERFILPIRGDLSFHEIWLKLETGGHCFRAQEPFQIDGHTWMGAIWQRAVSSSVKKGGLTLRGQQVLKLAPDAHAVSAITSDQDVRLTLTVKRVPYLIATWRKLSKNYYDTFRFVAFLRFFVNSTILTILNIGSQLLVCPLIAFGFSRLKWPGRDFIFGLLLATMMLPPQVTMIPQFLIFRVLGMYDTLFPLWLPSLFGTGFYIFLLRQFFMTIPYDYEEAAKLDGCGFIRRYLNISLPLIRPAMAAVVIFQFMATWNDFLRPLIFLNSEDKIPLPLGLFFFRSGWWNAEYGILMAASVVMILPVLLVFFLAQRHFIESISLTGSKG